MSASENTETVDQETKLGQHPRKRIRHRKKQLYDNILKQMEFYFSDANLNKDRFLGDLIKTDPSVPLDVFLKFNKIRAITQDIQDIVKAMKNSTLLELSEDKLKVKRKTPVLPYDADVRTLYVESIPVTASRDWLKQVFSDYGHVAYISLPKFKNKEKIKGYGFIEFNKPEDAQRCLNTFTKMGCRLPTSMPPEQLSSIKMFSVEDSTDDPPEPKEVKEDSEPPKKKKKNKEKKPQKGLDLKLDHESDSEKRVDTPNEENKSILTPSEEENKTILTPSEENKTIGTESKDELTSQDESKEEGSIRKKKTRKRTAQERSKAKNGLSKNEAPKGALWGLQVLPKAEWKALRNRYLNVQRKIMKQLKIDARNNRHTYSSIPAPAESSVEGESGTAAKTKSSKTTNVPEKLPGLFVKEILPEFCLDVRQVKRTVRTNIHAVHVDAKEGRSEIIIRFDSAKAADEYCATSNNLCHVLSGPEEEEQWSRLEAARMMKRPRGRTRLLRAARAITSVLTPASPQPTHTHIRFDDE